MKIFNTLTKQLEPLPSPDEQKKLNMFVCGPTVYDYIHIGNARTFVMFDVVAKYLRYRGYDVNYIQNITDIDNKIIERAQKENTDPLEYAKKSGRTASMADDAVSRIDDSDRKRNRGDFALWKFGRPGDPSWPAPLGS